MEPISTLQALVLGIIQGLTEFLPISSTAHVLIVSRIMGWADPGAAFTAVTQIGTEAAVLLYFRKDIAAILGTWFRSLRRKELRTEPHARMGWYIVWGTLPIGILGILFKDAIETSARNLWLVAGTLIVMGLVLGYADMSAKHVREESDITPKRALAFGLGQALALIPGVSRSGATITAGLFMGFTREVAARYSFLLAIPAVLASALLEALKIGDDKSVSWPLTIMATAIAFVVAYIVISSLMKFITTRSFKPFVIYRLGLGVVLLVLLATNVISATA